MWFFGDAASAGTVTWNAMQPGETLPIGKMQYPDGCERVSADEEVRETTGEPDPFVAALLAHSTVREAIGL